MTLQQVSFPALLPRLRSVQTTLLRKDLSSSCLPLSSRVSFPACPKNYPNEPASKSHPPAGTRGHHTFLILQSLLQPLVVRSVPKCKFCVALGGMRCPPLPGSE